MAFDHPAHELFAAEWRRVMARGPAPTRLNHIRTVDFEIFREQIMSGNPAVVGRVVDAVYAGDILILRNAFPADRIRRLRAEAYEYARSHGPVEGAIIDGCPNLRYRAETSQSDGGGYGSIYNVYNFFRWNEDPLGIFDLVAEPYRLMKTVGGFPPTQFEDHLPSDGVVDKIEFLHYPRGGGGIDMHSDPANNVKLTMGMNLTEAGEDYRSGGFVTIDADGAARNIERDALLGSIISFFPTVNHGVDAIDPGEKLDWESGAGRWFLGITSVHSHLVENRDRSLPVDGYATIHEQKRRASVGAG